MTLRPSAAVSLLLKKEPMERERKEKGVEGQKSSDLRNPSAQGSYPY